MNSSVIFVLIESLYNFFFLLKNVVNSYERKQVTKDNANEKNFVEKNNNL